MLTSTREDEKTSISLTMYFFANVRQLGVVFVTIPLQNSQNFSHYYFYKFFPINYLHNVHVTPFNKKFNSHGN